MDAPYYCANGVTLYLGDALEIIPRLAQEGVAIGTVWADPPYGVQCVQELGRSARSPGEKGLGTLGSGRGGKRSLLIKKKRSVAPGQYMPVIGDDSIETASLGYQACVRAWRHAVQIWWGANHYSAALPSSPCWILWDKRNSGVYADGEMAWCSEPSAVRIFAHRWNGMLRASERGEKRIHPNQKPIALAQWCLRKYHRGGLLLDPFSGSGSALLAARSLGVAAIGIEMSPHYCEAIVRRLAQHGLDLEYETPGEGPTQMAPEATLDSLWEPSS